MRLLPALMVLLVVLDWVVLRERHIGAGVTMLILAAAALAAIEYMMRRAVRLARFGHPVTGRVVKISSIRVQGLTDVMFEYDIAGRTFRRRRSLAVGAIARYALRPGGSVELIVDLDRPKRFILAAYLADLMTKS